MECRNKCCTKRPEFENQDTLLELFTKAGGQLQRLAQQKKER
jgi:hypothetical protein